MKKIGLAFCMFFLITAAFAQSDTTAPYFKTKLIPSFKLLNVDSVLFTESVLVKDKHTLFMLFNPDCGHCKEQLELLLTIPEITQNTQVILATGEPLHKIKAFREKYELDKYPFIFIGKDYKYFFGAYFQPRTIPVLAFYNAAQKFVSLHQGNATKKQVQKALE
jgi:thiol-disulfide isomerase/thioredoxin